MDNDDLVKDAYVTWAAYHAQSQPTSACRKAKIALLPLFYENANSVAMIKHAMTITKEATEHLNPGQIPVIAMDQPLFSLAKQIQWTWPHLSEENFVVMLGGLHIEMAILNMLGKWLDGSGWSSALVEAGVATSGRAAALLSASHVKRSRYAHQVTVASLYILQNSAYHSCCKELPASEEPLPFEIWCQTKSKQHPQFYYWTTVMELELLMLQFIRLLREGNFYLYLDSLNQLAPWFFALDRVHYARWLPVHIRDMNALNITHPSIHSEFHKGNFVVQRSTHPFSSMAMDQSHEQLNKSIKGEGGAVGLTEDPVALRRWMIAGPELSRVVTEFEDTLCDVSPSSNKHHEQVPHVQMTFAKDVKSLVVTFEELGNPFLEYSKELVVLDTKIIMHDKAVQSVMSAKQLGIEQYHAFVADRIISNNNAAITDTLSKNSLPLFHSHVQNENSKSHLKQLL